MTVRRCLWRSPATQAARPLLRLAAPSRDSAVLP